MHSVIFILFTLSAAQAETKITEKMSGDEKDTSVFIQKKTGVKIENDFEISSGEEEIEGEPTAGTKAARAKWTAACNEWKKEFRENNKENSIIQLSCGTAKMETDGTGSGDYTYRSTGKYKIKVRVKDASK